ncbi:P-loop NTPase family protein [Gemmatimonas sp.]
MTTSVGTPASVGDTEHEPLPPILRRLFASLEAARVPYVLLRGYLPVTELRESLDIDVFIPELALPAAAPVLESNGWRRRAAQTGRYPHVFFDNWESSSGMVRSIDVVTSLCFGTEVRRLLRDHTVLEGSETEHGIRVPAPWLAACCFALHVLLDKRGLSNANQQRGLALRERCRADAAGSMTLAEQLGSDTARLTEDFLQFLDENSQSELTRLIQHAERLPALAPQRLLARWHTLRTRWRQFVRPVARIAIFGIDGSGKSTLVQMATDQSGTLSIHNGYLGNNAYRTPPAKWLSKRIVQEQAKSAPSSLLLRVLINIDTFWRPFELAARMLIAEHRAELVMYDRFPIGQDDGTPTTVWGRVVLAYTRAGRALLPAPDLVILLDGDDHTIWSRKQEMPFEVHVRTQAKYRKLVSELHMEHAIVRTDGTLNESFSGLRTAIASCRAVQAKLYSSA